MGLDFFWILLFFLIILFESYSGYNVAKKFKISHAWVSWIPIFGCAYIWSRISKKSLWFAFPLLIYILIPTTLFLIIGISSFFYLQTKATEKLGFPKQNSFLFNAWFLVCKETDEEFHKRRLKEERNRKKGEKRTDKQFIKTTEKDEKNSQDFFKIAPWIILVIIILMIGKKILGY
jgi:hypothetical protein